MRFREAIAVCAATAAFMLIAQPERLWNPPADAQTGLASARVHTLAGLTQDAPPQRDEARDHDRRDRDDGHRGNGRRPGRRGGGDRDRFDRNNSGFPPFEPMPDPEEFSAELITTCIEVAREVNPDLADRLRTLCDQNPDEFEQIMRTRARRILGLAMLKHRSPELYNLRMQDMQYEQQAEQYAEEMRDAIEAGDTAEAEDVERRLRNVLEMKFALSMKARHDYIRLMEQHLESMWQSFKDDAGNFQATIDRQVERYKNPPRRRWDRHRDLGDIEIPPPDGG